MVGVKPDEISAILREQLSGAKTAAELEEVGTVLQIGDGIARIYGLSNALAGELVEFENGADAIAFIDENKDGIELVITDLNLPFFSGKQIVGHVKNLKDSIKIIVLTSLGVENTELEVFELGADDFITKPFSPAILLKRIEKLVVSK